MCVLLLVPLRTHLAPPLSWHCHWCHALPSVLGTASLAQGAQLVHGCCCTLTYPCGGAVWGCTASLCSLCWPAHSARSQDVARGQGRKQCWVVVALGTVGGLCGASPSFPMPQECQRRPCRPPWWCPPSRRGPRGVAQPPRLLRPRRLVLPRGRAPHPGPRTPSSWTTCWAWQLPSRRPRRPPAWLLRRRPRTPVPRPACLWLECQPSLNAASRRPRWAPPCSRPLRSRARASPS